MTTVTFYQDKEENYIGLTLDGHADYDESGQDIVCAALSFLVINTENSIELFTGSKCKSKLNEENGYMDIRLDKVGNMDQVQLLMKAMIHGITSLSKQYKKHIRLIFEEV